MNNTNEAAIIDGPEDVLNSNEEYKPNTTDSNPCLLYTSPSPRD